MRKLIRKILFHRRRLRRKNSIIRNKLLARTLMEIARTPGSMYRGSLAKKMAKTMKKMRGPQTMGDFRRYKYRKLTLLYLPIDSRHVMVTLSNRTGGPQLAFLMNAIRGRFFETVVEI